MVTVPEAEPGSAWLGVSTILVRLRAGPSRTDPPPRCGPDPQPPREPKPHSSASRSERRQIIRRVSHRKRSPHGRGEENQGRRSNCPRCSLRSSTVPNWTSLPPSCLCSSVWLNTSERRSAQGSRTTRPTAFRLSMYLWAEAASDKGKRRSITGSNSPLASRPSSLSICARRRTVKVSGAI
jgi:hypothetical protein